MKDKKQIKKKKKNTENIWKTGTFVLGAVLLLLLVLNIIADKREMNQAISPEVLCSKATKTPAWADSEGNVIAYGFKNFGNQSSIVLDMLIEEGVYFIYHHGCGYCAQQIIGFGEDWDRYVESGLTLNCAEVKKE